MHCARTSRRPWHPSEHVQASRPLRGRPHPELERSLPEGPAQRQGQPLDRHLFRRRRAHPGARLREARRGADAGREQPKVLPADRGRGSGPHAGAAPALRRRPRGDCPRPRCHIAVRRQQRRSARRRRLHPPLAAEQPGLGQRPDMGQPPRHVRGRRHHRPHLPLLRRLERRPAVCRHAGHPGHPAGAQRGAAARLLPQPDRRGPDARAVGRAGAGAERARAAALSRPCLPGLRRWHPGRRPRRAPAGRRGAVLLCRQLFLQEHERLRRARGCAQRRLRRCRRSRTRAGPAEGHRAPQLLEPGAACGGPDQPRAGRPRAACLVGGRRGRHARAHPGDAAQPA